jgi:hypothetical protein
VKLRRELKARLIEAVLGAYIVKRDPKASYEDRARASRFLSISPPWGGDVWPISLTMEEVCELELLEENDDLKDAANYLRSCLEGRHIRSS